MKSNKKTPLQLALVEHHKSLFGNAKVIPKAIATETTCPSCNSDEREKKFVKDGFQHVRCANCSLLYVNPRLNDRETLNFYNSIANELYNQDKFHTDHGYPDPDDIYNLELLDWTLETDPKLRRGATLLEIGAARGTLLRAAERRGLISHGIEINAMNARRLEQQFPDRIYSRDLLDLDLPGNTYDFIVMRDVIEHIASPQPFLAECFRILKPGGTISLATHNIDGLIHTFVGRSHSVIFGFEHPLHWSPRSLGDLLSRLGFEDLSIRMGADSVEIKFVISDISLSKILGYRLVPAWTWIFPSYPRLRPAAQALQRMVNNRVFGLRNPLVSWADSRLWYLLSRWTNRQSYFALLARKPSSDHASQECPA